MQSDVGTHANPNTCLSHRCTNPRRTYAYLSIVEELKGGEKRSEESLIQARLRFIKATILRARCQWSILHPGNRLWEQKKRGKGRRGCNYWGWCVKEPIRDDSIPFISLIIGLILTELQRAMELLRLQSFCLCVPQSVHVTQGMQMLAKYSNPIFRFCCFKTNLIISFTKMHNNNSDLLKTWKTGTCQS